MFYGVCIRACISTCVITLMCLRKGLLCEVFADIFQTSKLLYKSSISRVYRIVQVSVMNNHADLYS